MKPIKKISVKTVTGGVNIVKLVEHEKANPGTTLWLMDVIGIAGEWRAGETEKGAYVKFIGSFKAHNRETGEIFRSGTCFLPGAAGDMLYGVLKTGATEAQFGFRVGVKLDETSPVKYVYDVESILDVAESDPLEILEASINRPKLAAPKVDIEAAERARAEANKPAETNAGKGRRAA